MRGAHVRVEREGRLFVDQWRRRLFACVWVGRVVCGLDETEPNLVLHELNDEVREVGLELKSQP